ncbi:MAG: pseudouridine synthase [Cyclobacteriaceae bacterium]|nr:pseudouridine synthase [Cyclobacteriaceae bacterium]
MPRNEQPRRSNAGRRGGAAGGSGSFRKRSGEGGGRPWKKAGPGADRRDSGSSEGGTRRYGSKDEGSNKRFGNTRGSGAGDKPRYGKPRRDEGGQGERRYGKPRSEEGGQSERRYGKARGEEGGQSERRYGNPRQDEGRRYGAPRRDSGTAGGSRPNYRAGGEKPWKKTARPDNQGDRPEKPFESRKPYGKPSDDHREERPKTERKKYSSERYFGKPYGPKDKPVRKKKDDGEEPRSFVQARITRQREQLKDRYNPEEKPSDGLIRLNRFIANSGVCSRREADELIKMGLVSVNGTTITEMGHKVKPGDDVRYEGKRLTAEKPVYILLNKPKGFITTTDDPQERNTVMNLIAGACKERVYPVGRLDRNTTGLLLLTNDGELADKLTHPSYNIKKIYKAELDRPLTKNDFQKIVDGVHLEEGRAIVDDLAIVSDDGKTVGIELHIGWNHVVRRIFEALQYEVVRLDRVAYAGLDKKELERGHWRHLRPQEIVRLKHFQ